jgi:hypothetical protein
MKYTQEQIKEFATKWVAKIKATHKIVSREWDQSMVAAIPDVNESLAHYQELSEVLGSDVDVPTKNKAVELFARNVSKDASTAIERLQTIKVMAEGAYKSARDFSYIRAVAGYGLPSAEMTARDVARLVEKWGNAVTLGDGELHLAFPEFTATMYEAMRCSFKGVKLTINAHQPGKDGIFAPPADGPLAVTFGSAFTNQTHPHLLPHGICFGDSQALMAEAHREGRIEDIVGLFYQLMTDPKESGEHSHTFAAIPKTEFLCKKCKTWGKIANYKSGEFKFHLVANKKKAGYYEALEFHCKNCLPKCPVTGKVLASGQTVVINDVEYHKTAVTTYDGAYYLISDTEDLDGTKVPKKLIKTCFLTGTRGLPVGSVVAEAGASRVVTTKPHDLVALANGDVVVACCIDLINENGNFTGDDDVISEKPWWTGRIDTSIWRGQGEWAGNVASRYKLTATQRTAGTGQ